MMQQALGKNKETVTFYDKVLALDPDDTNALYSKGNAFVYLRNYPEAIALYDKVLATEPTFIGALTSKGNTLYSLGKYEDVIALYDKNV